MEEILNEISKSITPNNHLTCWHYGIFSKQELEYYKFEEYNSFVPVSRYPADEEKSPNEIGRIGVLKIIWCGDTIDWKSEQ